VLWPRWVEDQETRIMEEGIKGVQSRQARD
jgi:hypothetical protein